MAGPILLAMFLGSPITAGLYTLANLSASSEALTIPLFGYPLPWLVPPAIYLGWLAAFLFGGCVRKMRSERAHPYSKPAAVVGMAAFAAMGLGAAWAAKGTRDAAEVIVLVVLYGLVLVAMVLMPTITPDLGEYVKGVRRAERFGRRRPGLWDDASTNRAPLFAYAAIVALAATVAWEAIEGRGSGGSAYSQTIAIGVFVVAYVGLALQYFSLKFGKYGPTLLVLFLVVAWGVPLLVGGVMVAARTGPEEQGLPQVIMALSPVAGIALSAQSQIETGRDAVRMAALLPPITFAFVFNYLVVAIQRKIDLVVRRGHREESPAFPLTV
jgi:hypothetical protein